MKKYVILLVTAIAVCFSVASCGNKSEAIINAQVKAANLSCPMEIGAGLTLQNVEFNGKYVVYNYKGSEYLPFSQDDVTPDMKDQIVNTLKKEAETQADVRQFVSALKDAGVGIIYHYYSSSEAVMDVVVEASDF